jgi:hypothetical protein
MGSSLVSTTEELLERKSSDFGLENRDYDLRDHVTPLYPQKLALTSPTSGGPSVGIVHSWTKATAFLLLLLWNTHYESPHMFSFPCTQNTIVNGFPLTSETNITPVQKLLARLYSKTCPRWNVNKAETCSM